MKYIKQKLIKSKKYYYFEYALKTNGRATYTKYIGFNFPEDIKEKFKQYFLEMALLSSNSVSSENKKYFPGNNVESIEFAKFKYRMLNHELFANEFSLFKTLFYILFVLNSNRSEGSKVTRKDIEEVINKKIKPNTLIEKKSLIQLMPSIMLLKITL